MQPLPEKLQDFRYFLIITWRHLNLPDPTPVQLDIAEYLQYGPRRKIIQAFRGVGKSWITSTYVVWKLRMNPQLKFLVVSASKDRADNFSTFTMRLINEMPILAPLRPEDSQRNSKISFDVGPASADHAPSVKSQGVLGQMAGSRADEVIADDVEVPNNSATQMMRDKLSEQVKEFDAIIKPDKESKILFLGTPQCEDTVYRSLQERGYDTKIWPAQYITQSKNNLTYNDNVSQLCVSTEKENKSTEPLRFSDIDLADRKVSYGSAGFALQFMLDSKLSDVEKYPLKINDLLVMSLDNELAPEKVVWANDPSLEWDSTVPNVGMTGDRFHRPFKVLGDHIPYTGSVMSIDPAGRGKDETGFAICKMLNGFLYVPAAGGLQGGYSEETLKYLCVLAKEHNVNTIIVESNFGDGMFVELIKPILTKVHPCTIEEVRHSTQKERRIIDTLEPVMAGHKLVIDPEVIKSDFRTAQEYSQESSLKYQLIYQLSRLTRDRGAITHDDRLDALSIAIAYWTEQMAQDASQKMDDRKEELLRDELQKFQDSFHKARGSSVRGPNWL